MPDRTERMEQDIRNILNRLTAIETKLDDRDRRLEQLEAVAGRNALLTTVVSAVTASIILGIRYLAGK
jgi:hypothetical protein